MLKKTMTQLTITLFLTLVLASTVLYGQVDFEGRELLYAKGNSFNSTLILLDTLTHDTLEFDRQISRNKSMSILYENNKPRYKIYCKGYYDKKARETKKKERHHNFLMLLDRLHIKRSTNFFPTFYYGKSAKIKRRQIIHGGNWKRCKDKNIKPAYALFGNYVVPIDRKIRAKF